MIISTDLRRAAGIALLMAAIWPAAAVAEDRHAGYYYPDIMSEETYRARAQTMPDADREVRLGFVSAHTAEQMGRDYPPRYALFAKGEDAEKLIIVGLDDSFSTLFRARGVLAQLTAQARTTTLFRNLAVEDFFTFFDLAKMLGFEQITVTDGNDYAHRIDIE